MIIKNILEGSQKTKIRKDIVSIINEGLKSISPFSVFQEKIFLKGNILIIDQKKFDLSKFKNIYVIGFGKASSNMAFEIEKILGTRIKNGLVIDVNFKRLKKIRVKKGTHPYLSKKNIQGSKEIINMVKQLSKNDLVICLISGGGSALFEIPKNSFINTLKINKRLLASGMPIHEINTIRKHISFVKGGNLAQLTKAKIISLIFSDVIDDNIEIIASGPTVLDKSTILDTQKIFKKYKISKIKLYETPKDKKIFKKVNNFIILNNKVALESMRNKSKEMGYKPKIISNILSGKARSIGQKLAKIAQKMKKNEIYLFGGETTVTLKGKGLGGRNTETVLSFLNNLPKKLVFVSIDSDGIDNTDAAGAICDEKSLERAKKLKLNINTYLNNNDSYNFLKKTNDLIFTGPTGSNVADLILMLRK